MEENEKLLEEKRELLKKVSEAEEMGSKGMRTASTVQHRYSHNELFLSDKYYIIRGHEVILNVFKG